MPQPTPPRVERAHEEPAVTPAGNDALRQLRLRRFWTQADLASAFEARSRQIGRPLSLSVRQVRRWESCDPPLPLPAYQAVLEALFGVPIEEMGFRPQWVRRPEEPRSVPRSAQEEWERREAGAVRGAGGGAAGSARPTQADQERQDPVKRRQFMAGAVALGSGALGSIPQPTAARTVSANTVSANSVSPNTVSPNTVSADTAFTDALPASPLPAHTASARTLSPRTVGDPGDSASSRGFRTAPAVAPVAPADAGPGLAHGYAVITAQHRALYWTIPAAAMFAPVAAHSELGLGLLRSAGSPALRARLAAPVAETAMLAARLAFFDLQQPQLAEGYFAVALDAARESGDRPLTSAVLTHMAFVPAYAGHARRARDLMAEAHRQARGAVGATQLAWMCAVESEVEAKLGDGRTANDLIARSEGVLGGQSRAWAGGPDPQWLDFFDGSRLAGFKGFCRLSTGRCTDAAAALEQTLRTLPAGASKQRSITLADLARARAGQGELEESALLLGGAIDQLRSHWYATGVDRVDAVRRRLAAAGAPSRVMAPVDEARRALESARP